MAKFIPPYETESDLAHQKLHASRLLVEKYDILRSREIRETLGSQPPVTCFEYLVRYTLDGEEHWVASRCFNAPEKIMEYRITKQRDLVREENATDSTVGSLSNGKEESEGKKGKVRKRKRERSVPRNVRKARALARLLEASETKLAAVSTPDDNEVKPLIPGGPPLASGPPLNNNHRPIVTALQAHIHESIWKTLNHGFVEDPISC